VDSSIPAGLVTLRIAAMSKSARNGESAEGKGSASFVRSVKNAIDSWVQANTPRMEEALRSWLWPVMAYLTAVFWLLAVNIGNLPFGIRMTEEYFETLSEFDALAHYMTTLSLAVVGVQVLGRRLTVRILLSAIFLWEIFEFFTMPFLADKPGITTTGMYYADTLEDLAIGIAGIITGAYLNGDAGKEKV
jgi:hypothetical protein